MRIALRLAKDHTIAGACVASRCLESFLSALRIRLYFKTNCDV
ncbi:hypothetical protein [Lysobacter gummosus]